MYPELRELELPLTDRTLRNFGDSECGGTLAQSFRESCNTTFGQIGLDLGEELARGIENYGLNVQRAGLRPQARHRSQSSDPSKGRSRPKQPLFAQAAIGQADVAVTPLGMAMAAQAVANGGVMMVPHVLSHVTNSDGQEVPNSRYDVARVPTRDGTDDCDDRA